MFCKYCGKNIPDDSVFCKYCGKRVSDSPMAPANTGSSNSFSYVKAPVRADIRNTRGTRCIGVWRVPGGIVYINPTIKQMMVHVGNELSPVMEPDDIIDCLVTNDQSIIISRDKEPRKADGSRKEVYVVSSTPKARIPYTLVVKTRFTDHPLYSTRINGERLARAVKNYLELFFSSI